MTDFFVRLEANATQFEQIARELEEIPFPPVVWEDLKNAWNDLESDVKPSWDVFPMGNTLSVVMIITILYRLEVRMGVIDVAHGDAETLRRKDKDYGGSWKKRGGVGAFMMLARKWDRIENQLSKRSPDELQCPLWLLVRGDDRPDGLLDDVRDLRNYLLLVYTECSSLST